MIRLKFPEAMEQLAATQSMHEAQIAADYEAAMRQRRERAKLRFLSTERLSAEPRGNEVDLRRGRWSRMR